MGLLLPIGAAPMLAVALVATVVPSRHHSASGRRAAMAVAILLACGVWTLLRTDGFTERRLTTSPGGGRRRPSNGCSRRTDEPSRRGARGDDSGSAPVRPSWRPQRGCDQSRQCRREPPRRRLRTPRRSRHRAGLARLPRTAIATASCAACGSPPTGRRRRRSSCGGGRSDPAGRRSPSRGDLLYTQEQRGDDEIVAAYRVSTGEPVWRHRDAARFWESNGGAGPRATPTLSHGRVYAFGATGILNALDAATGARSGRATSPPTARRRSRLGLLQLAARRRRPRHRRGGRQAGRVRRRDRRPRWFGPGRRRQLQLSASADDRRRPTDRAAERQRRDQRGAGSTARCCGNTHDGAGRRRSCSRGHRRRRPPRQRMASRQRPRHPPAAVAHGPAADGRPRIAGPSTGLKPYFNDFVVHNGHAFGFDGSILACIDLADGTRKWKGGRYGNGQLVLLADQDLLLVLSEEGELVLVVGDARQVHRGRARPGDRRQDLESSGAGRRRPARAQRRGDGRVPVADGGQLKELFTTKDTKHTKATKGKKQISKSLKIFKSPNLQIHRFVVRS